MYLNYKGLHFIECLLRRHVTASYVLEANVLQWIIGLFSYYTLNLCCCDLPWTGTTFIRSPTYNRVSQFRSCLFCCQNSIPQRAFVFLWDIPRFVFRISYRFWCSRCCSCSNSLLRSTAFSKMNIPAQKSAESPPPQCLIKPGRPLRVKPWTVTPVFTNTCMEEGNKLKIPKIVCVISTRLTAAILPGRPKTANTALRAAFWRCIPPRLWT